MAIKKTITNYDTLYIDLQEMRRNNFSYEGTHALMEFIDELSDELGVDEEYDPIAWCCYYTEYANLDEFNTQHDPATSIEEISDRTTVILVDDDRFIIQNY